MITLFALRHRRKLRAANRATQRASRSAATARRVATDKRLRKETRLALSALVLASKRGRKVGLTNAPRDKRVAGQVRRAGRHASRAIAIADGTSRKRRTRKTATLAIGAGALGGAAYAGWKRYTRPQSPETPFPVARPADAAADGTPSVSQVGAGDGTQDNGAAEPLARPRM
jgi:uncharacterized membrane protein YebE (DUF533 family)